MSVGSHIKCYNMSPTRGVDSYYLHTQAFCFRFCPKPSFPFQILSQTQAFCSRFGPKPSSIPDFAPNPAPFQILPQTQFHSRFCPKPSFLFQILPQAQASSCLQALEKNCSKLQGKIQSSGLLEVQVHCIVQRNGFQARLEHQLYTVREAGEQRYT